MIKMETIMMGLLLVNVLLLFVVLWRTEMSMRVLKKQTKLLGARKELENVGIVSDISNTDTKIKKSSVAERILEEPEKSTELITDEVRQETIFVNGEKQEKEDLINEVLFEIFS